MLILHYDKVKKLSSKTKIFSSVFQNLPQFHPEERCQTCFYQGAHDHHTIISTEGAHT